MNTTIAAAVVQGHFNDATTMRRRVKDVLAEPRASGCAAAEPRRVA